MPNTPNKPPKTASPCASEVSAVSDTEGPAPSEPSSTTRRTEEDAAASVSGEVPSRLVPTKERITFGLGGMTMFLGNVSIGATAQAFFTMLLGVSPALLSIALAVPRLWDAFTDPLMGRISDKFHSKFGRRRPFIFIGSLMMGLTFGLIWMVPAEWPGTSIMLWFIISSLIFYTCFTVFSVPFTSLSYEMTPDYTERTAIMGHATFWSKVAEFGYQWLIPLGLGLAGWGLVDNDITGIRTVMWSLGLIFMFGFGVMPAIFTKERYYAVNLREQASHETSPFWRSLGQTLKNKAFVVILGIALLQIIGGMFASTLDHYLLVYYMFDGDILTGSIWKGYLSSAYAVCGFISIPVMVFLSKRFGKRTSLRIVFWLVIINGVLRWFIYTPGNHPFIFADAIIGSLYWIAVGTVQPSMIADTCDADELKYGERREGMFSSIFGWITKCAIVLGIMAGGFSLSLVGFDAELGGSQSDSAFLGMRLFMVLGSIIPNLIALGLLSLYPITKEQAARTRLILETRRGKVV
ncbi:MAG: MFS transporter [Opitutales bacterium]